MILIADQDRVIQNANLAATALLGTAVDELGTVSLSDLAGFEETWSAIRAIDEAHDWVVRTPDGEARTFSVRVSALRDPEGETNGYVVVGDDVSARREAEAVLRETVRNQAAVVERMIALDAERSTFIATASHELRTPVAAIIGYTELLAEGSLGELAASQADALARVVRNGRRLEHLIEDLLIWDRIGAGQANPIRTNVAVTALLDHTLESVRVHLAKRHLTLTSSAEPHMPVVSCDPLQLERALLNVLTNAIKFTPDGGSIRLTARSDHRGVVFEVTDTGIGIAQTDQQAVFEPFFRTQDAQNNAVQGSGIGLAVVRRIVDSHGGRVTLTSSPGRGTSVRMSLPSLKAASLAPPA